MQRKVRLSKHCALVLLLITFAWTGNSARGQEHALGDALPENSKRPAIAASGVWLNVGLGLGGGVYRDMGTAPLRYRGATLLPQVGVRWQREGLWNYHFENYTGLGIYKRRVTKGLAAEAFDVNNTLRATAYRRLGTLPSTGREGRRTPVELRLGVGLRNFLDVTINTNYDNATAGVSELAGAELTLRARQGMRLWHRRPVYWHAECGLVPVAMALRPGYAYVDNYTASQPVSSSFFDDFEWAVKPLAGLTCSVGIELALGATGNSMEIDYRWNYYSTGKSGAWRFDHATHRLCLGFNIKL